MGQIVDFIEIIHGTDRSFTLIATNKLTREPEDLSGFVGASGDAINVSLPGEDNALVLDFDPVDASKIEVESVSSGKAGKVKVTISDATNIPAKLKEGNTQDIEMEINLGPGPDFDVKVAQYIGVLNVVPRRFP